MGIDNAKGIRIKQMPEYLASSGDHSLFYAAQSFLRFSNGNVQSR